jgi:hypothetical protein
LTLDPDDEFNRILEANVRPPDWVNPRPSGRYNLVVIGAGTAGLATAAIAAGLGAKVALIERHLMGGDCLNVGCVPSKALVRASRAWADVRDAGEFCVNIAPDAVGCDFAHVMARMRRLRARLSPHDSARRFASLGVDVFLGAGKFSGPETIQVGGTSPQSSWCSIRCKEMASPSSSMRGWPAWNAEKARKSSTTRAKEHLKTGWSMRSWRVSAAPRMWWGWG